MTAMAGTLLIGLVLGLLVGLVFSIALHLTRKG